METETFVTQVAPPLTGNQYGDHESREGLLVSHTLRAEGHDASEDGTGRGPPLVPVAFSSKDSGADATEEVSPTMRAMPHDKSHPNAGGQIVIAMQERLESLNPDNGPHGKGWSDEGVAFTMEARNKPQSVGVALRGRDGGGTAEVTGDVSPAIRASQGGGDGPCPERAESYVPDQRDTLWGTEMMVRRITPKEAERLMGLEDDYTLVPYRGKPMADGPRYRMLGNAIAINVLSWLGQRIAMMDEVLAEVRRP